MSSSAGGSDATTDRTVSGDDRLRKRGGGHPTVLCNPRMRLLFILFYARYYPSQDTLGLIFGLSQGQVSHWLSRLIPVAVASLGRELIPADQRRTKFKHLLTEVPEILEIIRERSSQEMAGEATTGQPVSARVHALIA